MCGLLTSFHERLFNINFLLYNNRVHLEKGNNSLSTHAQLGEHNEKELYNNQQDEGGGGHDRKTLYQRWWVESNVTLSKCGWKLSFPRQVQ